MRNTLSKVTKYPLQITNKYTHKNIHIIFFVFCIFVFHICDWGVLTVDPIGTDDWSHDRHICMLSIVMRRRRFFEWPSEGYTISCVSLLHLKGHLAPRVSHVTLLGQRVIPGSRWVTSRFWVRAFGPSWALQARREAWEFSDYRTGHHLAIHSRPAGRRPARA